MLVAGDGRTWGTISGGCLERDVARSAQMLIPEPQNPGRRYETEEEDVGEKAARPVARSRPIARLRRKNRNPHPAYQRRMVRADARTFAVVRERRQAALATVIHVDSANNDPLVPGVCLTHLGTTQSQGKIVDQNAPMTLLEELRKSPPMDHAYELQRHNLARGGWAEVLLEWMSPSQALAIFGDGHDVGPLVELAHILGWHVTVVGSRPQAALRQNFPRADQVICSPDDPAAAAAELPADAAAIVMAHNFHRDAGVLTELSRHPRGYIGILGPRRRTTRLLAAAGCAGDEENIYSPVGLDLGAESPEQIALAIVAEIQAVAAGRAGNSLRRRSGPIHLDRPNAETAKTIQFPER